MLLLLLLLDRIPPDCRGESFAFLGVFEVARVLRRVNRRFAADCAAWLAGGEGAHALFRSGIAFQLGLQGCRLRDDLGRRMVEASAENGDPCAEAYCDLEGWGGRHASDWERACRTLVDVPTASVAHPWADFLMGYCTSHGYGVTADRAAALPFYERASAAGLCVAQNHLALMHMEGEGGLTRNSARARHLLALSAAQGNCRARYGLAMHDWNSRLPAFDAGVCLSMFTLSARQGHDEAQYQLGLFYEMGAEESRLPLHADEHKAVAWMQRAAEQGPSESTDWYGLAACVLGRYHEAGVGPLTPDKCAALKWYLRAAKVGNAEALYLVGGYCLYGYAELEADPDRAAEFYMRAADLGHARAANDLAVLLELGIEPAEADD